MGGGAISARNFVCWGVQSGFRVTVTRTVTRTGYTGLPTGKHPHCTVSCELAEPCVGLCSEVKDPTP